MTTKVAVHLNGETFPNGLCTNLIPENKYWSTVSSNDLPIVV